MDTGPHLSEKKRERGEGGKERAMTRKKNKEASSRLKVDQKHRREQTETSIPISIHFAKVR